MQFLIQLFTIISVGLHFSCLYCEGSVSYDGYKLLRLTPTTQMQLEQIGQLNGKSVGKLDFWLITTAVNQSADVMVPPSYMHRMMKFLNSTRIQSSVLIDDLGEVIREDAEHLVESRLGFEFYSDYNSMDEVHEYFSDLVNAHPDVASFTKIGLSYEGRPVNLLRISSGSSKSKPAIWIQAGVHARERIGPAVAAFIAKELFALVKKSDKLIKDFDWYILPLLNPDGYEYCKENRLWRKTRSVHPNAKNCIGVDANRNWDSEWNVAHGSSSNPCSNNYAGPEAFSEPETKAVSEFMLDHLKGRLKLFVDFHSYSQRWLSPWGYTSLLPPNYEEQIRLAKAATKALKKVHGTKYTVGSTGNIMYSVTGGARDWVYDVLGTPYSYVVELRDKGKFGFLLPREQILPTALETWEAIKAMGLELQKIACAEKI